MAKRLCFISTPIDTIAYREVEIDFEYFTGFSIIQKQKSIRSLHKNILLIDPYLKVLEVSTKSTDPIGVALSAFNLKLWDKQDGVYYAIENVFQSSKVFESGGPYTDLLYVSPKEAKKNERLKSSGKLICFKFREDVWPLEPKTVFYDWLYINALNQNEKLANDIMDYDAFTDIEFNHRKSFNCQARAAAIFVSLYKNNKLREVIQNKDLLKEFYPKAEEYRQDSFFDM